MKIRLLALLLLAASVPALAQTNLIQNGSFEANGGPNSNVLPGWSIVDEAGGNGTWVAQTGKIGPVTSTCGPDDVDAPPDGQFAAMTTQASAGSHVLYQDVTIPSGATAFVSFRFYVRSIAGITSIDNLSQFGGVNQQFRADVIDPSSNPFTLNVLQNLLVIGTGNPRVFPYELVTATLRGLGGRTVRIRFAEVDNQGCFYAGVDDVRVTTDAVTLAPAITRFTVMPGQVPFGGASTLSWVTQNATSVTIDNGIGPVDVSGSRSVSVQTGTSFTITATSPVGTASRTTGIAVGSPGPAINFSADPSFIQKGGTATLRWTTTDATDVSIDNNIGAVATNGSLTVTPPSTTAYTLTATGGGITSTARATVFVDPGDVPIVSVTSSPSGIVGVVGASGLTDRYALTNLGRVPTTITLTQSGDFFTQSPTSFPLAAGATQIVTITTTATAAGRYDGTSIVSGAGVPAGQTVNVRLFLAVPPTGTVAPTTAVARTEIAAPADQNPTGFVSFTNTGTGTLQGITTADVTWLIPQSEPVIIAPGETRQVTFTANRALRPDAASLAGAAVGVLTLSYIDQARIQQASAGGRSSISVTVVDVVKASATLTSPQPLAPNELAFFIPGLTQLPNSSGDLLVSVIGNSISDLKLFLGAPGKDPVLGSVDQIAPNAGLALPSVLQSVFASNATVGTVQARSANLSRLSLAGLETTAGPAGSFVTSLPTFRSDRSAATDELIYLPGVEKSATRSTTVYVQEVSGLAATTNVEFLDASGAVVNTRDNQSIAAFSLLTLPDAAPANAASVRITNSSRTAARLVAYAKVIDAATRDSWTIVDSQSFGGASTEQIVAIPTAPGAVNTLYLLNPDSAAVAVTVDNVFTPARRRVVRNDIETDAASTINVGPRQTVVVPMSPASGFTRVTASRPVVVSARSVQTSFGSALPVTSAAATLATGGSRRFASVDDGTTPLSYRSNVGLLETTGQPASVRLTLRYTFSAGSKTSAQGLSTTTVQVPAGRLMMINGIARAVIGATRDGYGDLRNMQLDVEVVGGAGRIFPFVQTIDNRSNDSAIRTQ